MVGRRTGGGLGFASAIAAVVLAGLALALVALITSVFTPGGEACSAGLATATAGGGSAPAGIVLGPPGTGQLVGATEYGGPGDPSSGVTGSSGANLLQLPDSYAELGGDTFQTATAMGGLPYLTPLRITWGDRSAIAYKRDIGLGGGPIAGLPRVLDLWWELAGQLGIPYEDGLWSGPVKIERPPQTGAGNVLGQASSGAAPALIATPTAQQDPAACAPEAVEGVPVDDRRPRRATPERARCRAGGRPARRQADHLGRQPDRRQAVRVRGRPRPSAVDDRSVL